MNDGQGLLLHSSGEVPAETSAVTEMFRNAQKLDPTGSTPTITIETDVRRVVITAGECGGSIAVFTDPAPHRHE